jgi:hypothetical protein
MQDLTVYQVRREELKETYLPAGEAVSQQVRTAGVDHLALLL